LLPIFVSPLVVISRSSTKDSCWVYAANRE
jgi:hypothetical protein